MACRALHMWSLSGLVGAFVDLAVAYFLLCASSVAYLASKFLGLFGLCLPCPCTVFGGVTIPNGNFCIQNLLIDYPTDEYVTNIHFIGKKKFPFNVFGSENVLNGNFDEYLTEDRKRNFGNGSVEIMEGEASCSSVSDARKGHNVGKLNSRSDVKGKGGIIQKSRGWLHPCPKGGAHYGSLSSVFSCDPRFGDVAGGHASPSSSIRKDRIKKVENRLEDFDSLDSYYVGDDQTSRVMRLGKRDSTLFDELPDENYEEKKFSSSTALAVIPPQEIASNAGEKMTIKILEQALKEEQAARRALYLELEKERSAAASAVDEAMAMILRLQDEKAAVELEAWQYHRINEEKSAYDAEEMNILKEIVVRREKEKHYLEKQVEKYRQIILTSGEFPDYVEGIMETEKEPLDSLLNASEDPVSMLRQLSAFIDGKSLTKDKQTSACSSNKEQNFHEKEMVSISENLYEPPQNWQESIALSCENNSSQEHNFREKTISIVGVEDLEAGDSYDRTDTETPGSDKSLEQWNPVALEKGRGSCLIASDKEPQVHDIHVILDEPSLLLEDKSQGDFLSTNEFLESISKGDYPCEDSSRQCLGGIRDSPSAAKMDIQRSTSEMTTGLPQVRPLARSTFPNKRRSSMAAMDHDRLKMDHEIGLLWERLKIMEKGREKLNPSTEHCERERIQLKLLEDIAYKLQEIQVLTDSGRLVRQKSLPPPSTKVTAKRRRPQSDYWGVSKSS